jgi:hypothetical protein
MPCRRECPESAVHGACSVPRAGGIRPNSTSGKLAGRSCRLPQNLGSINARLADMSCRLEPDHHGTAALTISSPTDCPNFGCRLLTQTIVLSVGHFELRRMSRKLPKAECAVREFSLISAFQRDTVCSWSWSGRLFCSQKVRRLYHVC